MGSLSAQQKNIFIQSLLNYVRVPYTRVVVVEKEGALVAICPTLAKALPSVTQTN